jgi:acetyltransferase-like isoleucine patch superfamily enzyme
MLRPVMEALLRARIETRLKVWILKVRLRAVATGSLVVVDVDPSVRLGRRVGVQFDRGTSNRLSIGPRTLLRDDVLLQLRGGTIEIGPDCDVREACRLNVAGRLVLEGRNVLGWACTVHCMESVRLAQMASCSEYVTIVDSRHFHSRDGAWFYSNSESKPVEIGRNVWLASKCTVIMGAQIGADSLVAANSVVGGVVNPETVVAGIPAKPVRSSIR